MFFRALVVGKFTGMPLKKVAWSNGNASEEVKQGPLAFLLNTDFTEPLKHKYALGPSKRGRENMPVSKLI